MSSSSGFAHTFRGLRRSPGYAAAAIVSVAVGLALATATFAFIDSLQNPRPVSPVADRVFFERLRFGSQRRPPSVGDRMRLLQSARGVEDVAVMLPARIGEVVSDRVQSAVVRTGSPNYWSMQEIPPQLGRYPAPDDSRLGNVVVVSAQLWHEAFDDRADLGGASIRVGDRWFDVVAVLPVEAWPRNLVFLPMAGTVAVDTLRESPYHGSANLLVKLRRGVTLETMAPELDRLSANLTKDYVRGAEPPYLLQLSPTVAVRWHVDSFMVLLFLLGFGILSIGCANVAALTLARGLTRRRDYAVRAALGAGRRALAAEVLREVSVVTVLGGVAGMGLTFAALGLLRHAVPTVLVWQGLSVPEFGAPAFIFSAVAIVAALAMGGAIPALRASRIAPNEPLKDGAGTTTGRSRSEFRALLIAELAIAMVLLMMASLEVVSLRNIVRFDFGFPAHQVVTTDVTAGTRGIRFSPRELGAMRQRTLELVRATPGVRAAALAGGRTFIDDQQIVSDRSAVGEPTLKARYYETAGPGFFTALGVPILRGREIEEGDVAGSGAAVLSESAARVLFPRGDAIGRLVKAGAADKPGAWVPVVGVTADFWERPTFDPDDRDPPVYIAAADSLYASWRIIARADSAAAIIRPMHGRLIDVLPPHSGVYVARFADRMDENTQYFRYFVRVFGSLGFAALALSALGLFSVMSYVVGQRGREFAVRVSLGASPTHLVRVVMRSAFEFVLGGTAIGALLSFWASAGLSGLLFGVKNTDPVSLVTAEVTLIAVCLLASLGPALRAARANPLDIIRAA